MTKISIVLTTAAVLACAGPAPASAQQQQHLRRVLTSYSIYYNETRTHLGLAKDAPLRRAVQRSGTIVTTPILSGLHHRYARI